MKFEFKFKKWGLRTTLSKLYEDGRITVVYFLEFGFGELNSYFDRYGVYFFFDLLRFKKSFYRARGFSMPIFTIKKHRYG